MVFVDTNIFVGALNERDSDHETCRVLLEAAFKKSDGLYTSDYIIDECFSVAWSKTRKQPRGFRFSLIKRLDDTMQGSEKIEILRVSEGDFSTAKSYLREHLGIIPTLTDWISLVLMSKNSISQILSLDRGFDKASKIRGFQSIIRVSDASEI